MSHHIAQSTTQSVAQSRINQPVEFKPTQLELEIYLATAKKIESALVEERSLWKKTQEAFTSLQARYTQMILDAKKTFRVYAAREEHLKKQLMEAQQELNWYRPAWSKAMALQIRYKSLQEEHKALKAKYLEYQMSSHEEKKYTLSLKENLVKIQNNQTYLQGELIKEKREKQIALNYLQTAEFTLNQLEKNSRKAFSELNRGEKGTDKLIHKNAVQL